MMFNRFSACISAYPWEKSGDRDVFNDDVSIWIKTSVLSIAIFFSITSYGQNSRFKPVDFDDPVYHISSKTLIIPTVLMGYGFAQFMVPPIKELNLKVRSEITGRVTKPFRIDDYSQWSPGLAVFGLNFLGVKGKHNFIDRSIVLGTSLIIMEVSVTSLKLLSHIQRPDNTAFNAFPSGHTATAFACAEFLYQEYKDVSPWIGVAGYTVAAGTGFMRMYNNRHWLTDVVAGAGFGILSTKAAYWIFPKIKKLLFKDIQVNVSLMPVFYTRYGQIQ
jgi:membrane-associated phospholipid phosphatase